MKPVHIVTELCLCNEDDRSFGYTMYEQVVGALLFFDLTVSDQYDMGGMDWIRATYDWDDLQTLFYKVTLNHEPSKKQWQHIRAHMRYRRVPKTLPAPDWQP